MSEYVFLPEVRTTYTIDIRQLGKEVIIKRQLFRIVQKKYEVCFPG
jgi:hypothetical protein